MLNGVKSSQKSDVRPISFLLDDPLPSGNGLTYFRFSVRPEDLTRVEPSRLSVHQTFGGAWADNFGGGIGSINISGHTGWRGDDSVWGGNDGMTAFSILNDTVFKRWHARRAEAVSAGYDPDKIKLIFADKLDDICSVVAPQSFTLRRSRSRPLLMQYNIALTVLERDVGAIYGNVNMLNDAKSLFSIGKTGLEDLADRIVNGAADITDWIGSTLGVPARNFMNMTGDVLKQVTRISNASDSVFSALVTVARDLARGGANIFRSFAVAASIPVRAASRMMEIAGIFWSTFCLIKRMFSTIFLPNYSAFFGASNCSSTAGGSPMSPLRNVNAMYALAGGVGAAAIMADVAGSKSGGISSLQSGASPSTVLSSIKGAIPGFSSVTKDVFVTVTDKAAGLIAELSATDPVANEMLGKTAGFMAGIGAKLNTLASDVKVAIVPVDTGATASFVGELSYQA